MIYRKSARLLSVVVVALCSLCAAYVAPARGSAVDDVGMARAAVVGSPVDFREATYFIRPDALAQHLLASGLMTIGRGEHQALPQLVLTPSGRVVADREHWR